MSELERLYKSLKRLCERGNTLILVDHDLYFLQNSDWLIDLGPTGGKNGGQLLSEFAPKDWEAYQEKSLTAKLLYASEKEKNQSKKRVFDLKNDKQFLHVLKASGHNLKIDKVSFLKKSLNVVSGVSGAGKTTLAIHTLYENLKKQLTHKSGKKPGFQLCSKVENFENLSNCHLIDRTPLAKTSASIAATYLGIFTPIRELLLHCPKQK